MDDDHFIVCDSGNHRVMIWNGIPTENGQPADMVLGQADFYSEGPACGHANFASGFHLPTGVIVANGKLLVGDAWHHRVLVWNEVPQKSQTPPDYALGQSDLLQVQPNRGEYATASSMYWPYGLAFIAGKLFVTDTGNRRVLVWSGVPQADQPAEWVLGQPDAASTGENRDGPVSANSFRWPHAVAGNAHQLWIADAGNHRVLGWDGAVTLDRPADRVLGQEDFSGSREWPYDVQGERRLRFPYGIDSQGSCLAVADTANNRILFWKLPIDQVAFAAARDVFGQIDFAKFGENHWQAVTDRSLCWPYGICLHKGLLAVADSGNNRVMIWDCSEIISACDDSCEQMKCEAQPCV